MAFSYNPALVTKKDQVRFLLHDTDSASPFLDDGEILWALKTEANVYMAAALCADALKSRSRGVTTKTVGSLTLSYGASEWKAIADSLRLRGSTHMTPTAGGVELADRETAREDTTLIQPSFRSDMQQDPENPPSGVETLEDV